MKRIYQYTPFLLCHPIEKEEYKFPTGYIETVFEDADGACFVAVIDKQIITANNEKKEDIYIHTDSISDSLLELESKLKFDNLVRKIHLN